MGKIAVCLVLIFGCLATVSAACGKQKVSARVIAGEDSKQGQWPWQVALYVKGKFSCGGTLVHPRWIVTAAHCIFAPAKRYRVVLGELDRNKDSSMEVTVRVKRHIKHPLYTFPTRLNNDIALIELRKPVRLSNNIATACLPKPREKVPVGSKCFISGWGKTSHPGNAATHLQHASLTVLSNTKCNKLNGRYNRIEEQMICASNGNQKQSGCHGDSGGPFVCKNSDGAWTLQGAVSWGSPECNSNDSNTVFARVAEFRDWINKYVK